MISNTTTIIFTSLFALSGLITLIGIIINTVYAKKNSFKINELQKGLAELLAKFEERSRGSEAMHESITRFIVEQQQEQHKQRAAFDEHQIKNLKLLTESLQNGMGAIREQIVTFLKTNTEELGKNIDKLTKETNQQLKEISGQVEKRLSDGFEKTTATFIDVVKRLALIDEAQKKITELSSNVVSLQEILTDKRSRGAFGEIQLEALISNILPQENFALQYTLSNNKRVDCMLFLPQPTGNIAVDAKFPLESYQRLTDHNSSDEERRSAEQQFKQDIRHHIQDILEKYIIAGETADGAIMFIPAEAVFAEIYAHHPDIVEFSHRSKVWMVSPTTMMAILTTARAVLKDAATNKQVHIIQKHLAGLSKDFERFQLRMDNLAKHIKQANVDVEEVHNSAQKISTRFIKIEKVDLAQLPNSEIREEETSD